MRTMTWVAVALLLVAASLLLAIDNRQPHPNQYNSQSQVDR